MPPAENETPVGASDNDETGGNKAWSGILGPVFAAADSAGARIIGISSDQRGAGVHRIARAFAASCAALGRETHFVDAQEFSTDLANLRNESSDWVDISGSAVQHQDGYREIVLSQEGIPVALGRRQIRNILASLAGQSGAVVAALPPVCQVDGRARPGYLAVGGACDQVFLVLRTGVVSDAQAKSSVQISRFAEIPLGGVILNDSQQLAARLMGVSRPL